MLVFRLHALNLQATLIVRGLIYNGHNGVIFVKIQETRQTVSVRRVSKYGNYQLIRENARSKMNVKLFYR